VALDAASVTETLSDTSNNQSFTITPDGTTFSNTSSGSVTYGGNRVVDVDVSNTLSRFPTSSNAQSSSPKFGYQGQQISDYSLDADLRAIQPEGIGEISLRSFVDDTTADGSTFAEGGQLSGNTLITRSLIPEFSKDNQRVISAEKLRWRND
jgi:hypothetical protein